MCYQIHIGTSNYQFTTKLAKFDKRDKTDSIYNLVNQIRKGKTMPMNPVMKDNVDTPGMDATR